MFKRVLSTAFLTPILVSAQQFGTKKDMAVTNGPVAAPTSSLNPMLSLMIALAVVFVIIKWGLPSLFKYLSKKTSQSGAILVGDSAVIGSSQVHLVSVMGRTLLIGSNPSGTNLLADLTVPQNPGQPELFAEYLHAETHRPQETPFMMRNETPPDPARITEALGRLERLVGQE